MKEHTPSLVMLIVSVAIGLAFNLSLLACNDIHDDCFLHKCDWLSGQIIIYIVTIFTGYIAYFSIYVIYTLFVRTFVLTRTSFPTNTKRPLLILKRNSTGRGI
jgi:hypothetical protein